MNSPFHASATPEIFILPFSTVHPPGKYRITLALIMPFGHVPHVIRDILRSFRISYFSTNLLMSFSYSSFNLSVLMRRVQ